MEYIFEENNRDTNDFGNNSTLPPGAKVVGYLLLSTFAAFVAWAVIKAAAAIAALVARGVILFMVGSAAIAALLAVVSIIGEYFSKGNQ